jgi:hypothetical protein
MPIPDFQGVMRPLLAGGPPFGFGFLSNYITEGGPSLRSLQGRVAMPPIGFISNSRGVSAVPTGLGSISLALTQD